MGSTVGYVVYVGYGTKLASAAELEPDVLEYTKKNYPSYLKSPDVFTRPNATSWSHYRKQRPPAAGASAPFAAPATPKP